MNAEEVVIVQHLVKRHGNLLVVNDVSFTSLLTMAIYTVIFGCIAIRSFRWE